MEKNSVKKRTSRETKEKSALWERGIFRKTSRRKDREGRKPQTSEGEIVKKRLLKGGYEKIAVSRIGGWAD